MDHVPLFLAYNSDIPLKIVSAGQNPEISIHPLKIYLIKKTIVYQLRKMPVFRLCLRSTLLSTGPEKYYPPISTMFLFFNPK